MGKRPMGGREKFKTRVRWLLVLLVLLGGATALRSAFAEETSQAQEIYDQGIKLLKSGKTREAIPILYESTILFPGNRRVMADYTIALVWAGEFRQAVAYYEKNEPELQEVGYLHKNIAKAFYELRNFSQARELYAKGWEIDPRDEETFKGLIYSCCRLEKYGEAVQVWEKARRKKLIKPELLEEIKIYLFENLGLSEDALKAVREAGYKNEGLIRRLEGDTAVVRLRWEEIDQAIALLEAQLAKQPDNLRARQDYIVALRKKDRMHEVLQQYDLYQKYGQDTPYWVNEAVADAYLYLKQPGKAAEYYRLVLSQHPDEPSEPLIGIFYTQVELRNWETATATLKQLDDYFHKLQQRLEGKYYALASAQGFEYENNENVKLQGLFLLYQDKNQQAVDFFKSALARAGLFTGFRNGLGQAYDSQHRPRLALEQFKISQGVDAKDVDSRIGMAYALNTLNYKVAARALAQDLYRQFPTNYHVQNLNETLQVEDSPYLSFDYYFTREFQGAVEDYLISELNAPVSTTFRVFTQLIWQFGEDTETIQKSTWNRLGAGFDWIALPTLTLRQSVSFDYLKGDELGSYTKLVWTPTDPLRITGEFNSFSLALPIRARAAGIQGKQATAGVTYTYSDLRDFGLRLTANMFSDSNRNYDFSTFFNQTIINHPDVKVIAGFKANYSRYTKSDVDYFSPLFDYTVLFTPKIEWIHYHYYDRYYSTSFYPRVGLNKQIAYDFFPVAGLTIEQKLLWSKKFALTASISYDLLVYNGVYCHVPGAYVGFKKYF